MFATCENKTPEGHQDVKALKLPFNNLQNFEPLLVFIRVCLRFLMAFWGL